MGDRGGAFIGFQTRLRRVGCVVRTVHEHVIPRLVPSRPSLVGLIPRLVGLAGQVEVHHYAAVPVSPVPHDLPRVIAWFLFGSFFDEATHEILGLAGRRYQTIYHFTVGAPVEDTRLTSLPAYPPPPGA